MNKENLITVGIVTSPHGVRGNLKLKLLTDFPERVYRLDDVYLLSDQSVTGPYTVAQARLIPDGALLKLDEIDSREQAKCLVGSEVCVTLDKAVTLPEGHYFYFELEGLEVYTVTGERLGILAEVLPLPANDIYVVHTEADGEILLPATREVVQEIDLEAGRMKVNLLPGLR
ncbi:MAG: 16S rRNA processing protein RimM [Firmicutes bacterium]|nr:16S rRNA processing protein RimM [Bacillota bacterium]